MTLTVHELEKLQDFLALGIQVSILIEPEAHCIEVYRAAAEAILGDGVALRCPVAVADLWTLVFE